MKTIRYFDIFWNDIGKAQKEHSIEPVVRQYGAEGEEYFNNLYVRTEFPHGRFPQLPLYSICMPIDASLKSWRPAAAITMGRYDIQDRYTCSWGELDSHMQESIIRTVRFITIDTHKQFKPDYNDLVQIIVRKYLVLPHFNWHKCCFDEKDNVFDRTMTITRQRVAMDKFLCNKYRQMPGILHVFQGDGSLDDLNLLTGTERNMIMAEAARYKSTWRCLQ